MFLYSMVREFIDDDNFLVMNNVVDVVFLEFFSFDGVDDV